MSQEIGYSYDHINIDNTMTTSSTPKYVVTNENGETIYQGNTMPSLENGEGHTIYILEDSVMDVQTETEVSTMNVPSEVDIHVSTLANVSTEPLQVPVQNVHVCIALIGRLNTAKIKRSKI